MAKKYKIAEAISIIAHQLKNPIAIIKGYLEALISGDFGKINPMQREYLNDAITNVLRMSRIIDNLIEVSAIEEGKYKLNLKKVSLEDIASDVARDFFHWAKASNCKIIFKKPKKLPQVFADPIKIRQVIENLISNAIKYNLGRGIIEVFVTLRKKEGEIIFCCKDNGISIPKEDFKKVFTKFYRSEKAMEIDPSGSGLGLYINKAIVELGGGKIWFSKNPKKGMTFCFSLLIAKK